MNLVKAPKQFDVIVTDNLFGDMLSDIAAMLTGSLGMLPSASLGEIDAKTKKRRSLFEPVHGSAPDIAGKGLANPIAMIASFGMALRYSFDMGALADKVDAAIAAVLASGLRTADIKSEGTTAVSTTQMGEAILKELQALHGVSPRSAASTRIDHQEMPGPSRGMFSVIASTHVALNTAGTSADIRPCPTAGSAAGDRSGGCCSRARTLGTRYGGGNA